MMKTLDAAILLITTNPVFRLVNLNVKTGGIFSFKYDITIQSKIIEYLAKAYPELECYFHPLNHYFLEFSHKKNFENLMEKFYPGFAGQSLQEIVANRQANFTQAKYEVFYGRVFNYPEDCISEFSKGFSKNSTAHLLTIEGFAGNVVVKCSEETKPQVVKLFSYWEKCLS